MAAIQPLTRVTSPAWTPGGILYEVHCRDCGPILDRLTVVQADMVQRRHLAAHLEALSAEITAASQ